MKTIERSRRLNRDALPLFISPLSLLSRATKAVIEQGITEEALIMEVLRDRGGYLIRIATQHVLQSSLCCEKTQLAAAMHPKSFSRLLLRY